MINTKAISKASFFTLLAVAIFVCQAAIAQNNSILLNGAFINMSGGSVGTKVFLVIDQTSTSGISRSSGHIISENQYNYIRWRAGTGTGNYIYPFGYSTTDYLPVTLNKTTAGSANIDASTWGTDNKNQPHAGASDGGTLGATFKMHGIGDSISSVIDRWWDFYPSGALTANLTFSYRGAENATTSNTGDNLDMQHWNGSSWDAPVHGSTTGVISGIGTLSVTGVTAFSPMVIIHRTGSLPVTIVDFSINCADKGINLYWSTASEINSGYFNIERSLDGLNFNAIAKIDAAGNSNALLHYKFIDYDGFGKTSYYRLKEVDLDGKIAFSNIVSSNCNADFKDVVNIFPNPVLDFINYNTNIQITGLVTIEIHDQAGQTIIREQHTDVQDFTIPATDVSMLTEGFYFAKVIYEQKVFLKKFIKLKE